MMPKGSCFNEGSIANRYRSSYSSAYPMNSIQAPKATDSPWFWVYLFSTFALVALVLMQPKFDQRQSTIERKWQATRIVNSQGVSDKTNQSSLEETPLQTNSITVLILILAATTVVGWIVFWRSHVQRQVSRTDGEQLNGV